MPVDVAKMVGVDRRSVRRWKSAYLKEGEKGIQAKPASGRPCKLDEKGRKKLEEVLLKGAKSAGFDTDLNRHLNAPAVIIWDRFLPHMGQVSSSQGQEAS